MPWGVPSSGDAAKPRKVIDCWNGFPCPDVALTLLAFWSRNCVSVSGRCTLIARLPKICTLAGTSRIGTPRPGSGVVPITCTAGNSSTSAGLSAAPARPAVQPAAATSTTTPAARDDRWKNIQGSVVSYETAESLRDRTGWSSEDPIDNEAVDY